METYPVRVTARLDEPLSRGLWIVKPILALPHYFLLAFLWMAFVVLTAVAFFAILFTGRYPRSIFAFNLGVLRWSWRVTYYSFGALGTDRYPPFSLQAEPGYPATLDIAFPEQLSRGLVLVKWWLLAIPHYVIVALFTSGSLVSWDNGVARTIDLGGVIGILVIIAAITLLFTGRYPRGLFDLVTGMNRWALRVAAYAALMTDAYPPFRLDQGGEDRPGEFAPVPHDGHDGHVRHTGSSIAALSIGAVLVLGALATAVGGAGLALARGDDGYVSSPVRTVTTSGYALTSEEFVVDRPGSAFLRDLVGTVRVRAVAVDQPLFVGIARQRDLDEYLRGVAHDRLPSRGVLPGGPPPTPPGVQQIWAAQSDGTLTWTVQPGDWAFVIMNEDGGAGVDASVAVAATLPSLRALTAGTLAAAAVLLLLGAGLIVAGLRLVTVEHPVSAP
ncbi:DUF4389 domain-containing protein [Nonomuraea soli]|uniref:DUF4389 domain-containing protein n=1 Tax=Nonomuraea soli TaxID=1032476 RepID=A0A7W0HNS0_9ACTN|nr:DUF4389 domain-containing protein [Nonomuraea soli]MBA2890032.1 hypothetical protein [Nonomuraea soli]